jgi:hypothetical protein
MRKTLLSILLLAAAWGGAQAQINPQQHWFWASDYAQWSLKGQQPNTYSWQPGTLCQLPQAGGGTFFPFATNAPIFISDVNTSNNEVVTPSVVKNTASTCSVTISAAHSHNSFYFVSGSAGLQEALNALNKSAAVAGVVYLDRQWYTLANAVPGTTPAAIIAAASGGTGLNVIDITTVPFTVYHWNGSAYVATGGVANNGSYFQPFINSELITLSTGGTTTDSSANLLPAGAVIDMVQGVVNTTITASCTGWELGDPTTAARFTSNDTTLTAGEARWRGGRYRVRRIQHCWSR